MKHFSPAMIPAFFMRGYLMITVFAAAITHAQEASPKQGNESDQTDYVRFVDGEASQSLETAIVRFQRGTEIVDLVAVVHLADPDYFEMLNDHLKHYDSVLYEMVGGKFQDRDDNLVVAESNPEFSGIRAAHGLIQTLLDMEYQIDGIDYSAINFFHADVDWEQYSQLMEERNQSMATMFQRALFIAQSGEAIPGIPTDEKSANDMLSGIFNAFSTGDTGTLKRTLAPVLGGAEGLIQKIEGEDGTVLVTERNKVVMQHVGNHLDLGRKKIAVFYGAGHMPDLAERLEAEGFEQVAISWLTAWDIQPTPESESLTPLQKTSRDEELAGAIFNVFKGFMQMMADQQAEGSAK